ncbi:hypothetical protein BDZ90DRAFT_157764 [Jaminaea rosea]|uniref:Ras GEF n=1 Tax=Jaminaea rosea TaxID=1569628 RepID=A0A316URN3_9BASI|nr:hypothetical protein BDZ90DRAFT_157764 [Jaminaea rosea]PWN27952.1 hypothetical protein BDZ90DRAFT_157764 [Jaminaea rosea]
MLRRAKKRDQPLVEGYDGAASSSSSPMHSSPHPPQQQQTQQQQQQQQQQQPFYQSHHGSSRHLLNPSQSTLTEPNSDSRYPATSPKPYHPRLPSSSSAEAMPPPQPSGYAASPSASSGSQPMGRSQSTLNLFFSKAKNSITGSSQQQQQQQQQQQVPNLNSSNSFGSLGSLQEDGAAGSAMYSRPSISLQHPGAYPMPTSNNASRSSSSNDFRQVTAKPSIELDQSSLGFGPTSPTKKSFFSRERKTSMARLPNPSRMGAQQQQQQPYGGSAGVYGRGQSAYSKSQSDLHYASPRSQYAELPPRMPTLPQSIPDERSGASLLTSPSLLGTNGMSRSVEDLNHPALSSSSSGGATSAGPGPRSPSPQPGGVSGSAVYSSSPRTGGTWGEHGVPHQQQHWGRPSDIGTIGPNELSKSRQSSASGSGMARAISPSGSRPEQIPFSSASSQWPPQRGTSPTPEYASPPGAHVGHQRKGSKLPMVGADGFFGAGQGGGRERKATGSSLASSFSLTNVAAGASSVMDKLRGGSSSGSIASIHQQQQQHQGYNRERASSSADSLKEVAGIGSSAPLPPGCTHQGLLNRNANLSLSVAQLGGIGTREREKDVTKGWKPYKVLLRDHNLVFYKPPNNLADDVKGLFPSTVVRGAGDGAGLSQAYAGQRIDADMLKQSGLGTMDLLNATSNSGGQSGLAAAAAPPRSAHASPAKKQLPSPPPALSTGVTATSTSSPATTSSWHMPGAHPESVLVPSRERPEHWAQRIHSGTLEALVHEIIHATQLLAQDDPQDTATMIHTTLFAALSNGHGLVEFVSYLTTQVSTALQISGEEEGVEALHSAVRGRAGWCFDVLIAKYADAIDPRTMSMLEQLVSSTEGLNVDVAAAIKEQRSSSSSLPAGVSRPVPNDWSKHTPDPPRPKLASLAQGHFSASDLLSFEPADVASQIQIFHADRLRALAIPEPTMSALAGKTSGDSSPSAADAALFSFSGSSPHYLTTLILQQVLEGSDSSGNSNSNNAATLAQHARHRASLLRHWIAIASYSLSYGDVLAWTAIMAALCSRAISRLEHTWRLVAEGDRTLLASSWAPKLSKLQWNEDGSLPVEPAVSMSSVTSRNPKSKDGRKPQCIPFLGDSLVDIRAAVATQEQPQRIPIASLTQSSDRLYEAVTKWAGQSFKGSRVAPDAIIFVARPIVEFQQLLQHLSFQSGTAAKSISSYIDASLRLEPRSLGNIDRNWRPPLPASLNAKTLLPLVFPEALPNLDLLDRRQIVAAAASDDHRAMGSSLVTRDFDATIRGPSGAGSKYVRSPLSGTPLMRASIQSLSRSKAAAMSSPGTRAGALPFGLISEWSTRGLSTTAEEETIHRIGNELILKSVDDPPMSLPSTPMTSKRFSQDFGSRATRPLSQVSRRSSLPASQRSSVIETVLPTQVQVKAGTLERLVDVLVLGVTDLSISLSGNNDDASGPTDAQTKVSRLSLDLQNYRAAFLATFRSTCSPLVLFDFLRKRFLAAVNAGREFAGLPSGPNASRFPSWSLIDASAGATLEPVEWDFVNRVRHGVIAVLKLWVRGFTQDFVDEPELYDAIVAFVKQQQASTKAARVDDVDFSRAVTGLEDVTSLLRSSAFKTNAAYKQDMAKRAQANPSSSSAAPSARDLDFDFDQASPVALVDYLESVAGVFFDKITERDLLISAELLERQAQDPLGWHIVRDAGPDEPQVLTMYKLLELLRPGGASEGSSKASSAPSPSLGERMPASVRDACAAQSLLRGWIAIHIIETRIGVQHRQNRIEKLIDAIWLCRARMLRARMPEEATATPAANAVPLAGAAPIQDLTVGSFVESIIVASLTSSESRTFVRAWQGVCHARGGTGEGLDDLLPRPDALSTLNQAAASSPATPDVGWLLKSIAQALSRRSAVAQADSSYVDFERSQIVHSLIESSLSLRKQPGDGNTRTVVDPKTAELAGARLSVMQTKLRRVVWDRRAFKDDAAHEASSAPPLPRDTTWRAFRPLQKLMSEQQDKQQRDRHAFETLRSALEAAKTTASRSPAMGPQEIIGRSSTSSSVTLMVPAGVGGGGSGFPSDKKSRRMTSLWRGAARLGGGGGQALGGVSGGATDHYGQRPYSDLVSAIPISQKPSMVVSLGGADVTVWNNTQRSFVFHVSSLDGQRILLQASGQAELADWLAQMDKAVREGPRPAGSNDPRRQAGGAGRGGYMAKNASSSAANFTSLFGQDIPTLVEREGRPIPLGLERMFNEIESRGLQEVGIYRISGSKSTIEAMEQAFRSRPPESIDLQHGEFSDVHAISGLIKLWFRELPEPVVPFSFYNPIIEAEALENSDDRLIALRDLIWSFPKAHFDLLRRTCEHLARVVEEGEKNKMLPHNIGLIFGTSLLNPPPSATSVAEAFGQIGKKANVVKIMVQYYEWIFDPEPAEGEQEEDAEGEEAVAGERSNEGETFDNAVTAANPATGLEDIDEAGDTSATIQSEEGGGLTADELLAQLQNDASAAAAASAATNAGLLPRGGGGSAESTTDAQHTPNPQTPAQLSTADASLAGQALQRPTLPRRDSRREELSIYQDAVDIDLGESAAVAVRSSLLPDEAMMDVLRAMRHEEGAGAQQAGGRH